MTPSAKAALDSLLEGNLRFREGASSAPAQSLAARSVLKEGQSPSVCIIACSDSRGSPELIFDSPLGQLFVIRAAGCVLDRAGQGSLAYAVAQLGVKLVAVVGHSGCGLVEAACGDIPDNPELGWMVESVRSHLQVDGAFGDECVREQSLAVVKSCEKYLAGISDAPPPVVALHLDFDDWTVEPL